MSRKPYAKRFYAVVDDAGVWYPSLAKTKWEAATLAEARRHLARPLEYRPRMIRVLVMEIRK